MPRRAGAAYPAAVGVFVIDNGSTDETGSYVRGGDVAPVPVTLISNSKNIGFPAAINQGLRAAQGEFLVLLNNDAVVTDGWLNQLAALTEMIREGTTKHESGRETDETSKDTKGNIREAWGSA